MSLPTAQAFAWSLATTLMTAVILYRAGDGSFSALPASEFDGDPAAIIHIYDAHER